MTSTGPRSSATSDVLTAVMDSLPAHTAVVDADGRVLAVSRSWRRFALDNGGDDSTCGVGADYLGVCRAATGPEREEALDVADGLRRVCAGQAEQFALDYECSSPQERRWFQVSVVPLRRAGDHAARRGAVVSHSDITARKLDELELVHEATHDPLTGLVNRALLLAELRRELHRTHAEGVPLAVLHLDLDGFTSVNDALGHAAGDRLLRVTADRLRAVLRPGEPLARLGGDEFVALLPGTGVVGARRCARRFAHAVREPLELDGFPVVVSGSVGIAVGDGTPTTAEELLAGAAAAMSRARRRGRARTEVFAGQLRARAERREQVQSHLVRSLHDGSLQLFRQPVVDLADGVEVSGEALVRWFPPDGGVRAAEAFLDEVTHGALRRTVTDAVLWSAAGAAGRTGTAVGVNVSLPDLRGGGLVADLERVLGDTGCPPALLSLEVGEHLLGSAPALVRRTVSGLDDLGVGVVVDHLAGTVPPATLASLPVQGWKLDRGLVATATSGDGEQPGRRSRAVLRSLVRLAGDLGVELTAVGVETAQQQQRLLDDGIRLGQGWRLGPPAPWTTVRGRPDGPQPALTPLTSGFAPGVNAD